MSCLILAEGIGKDKDPRVGGHLECSTLVLGI